MGKELHQSIVIDTKIKTTLEGMNETLAKLDKGLRDGTTKLDLTKGVGNSISKQIETFKTEYQKFAQMTKDNKVSFMDSKEAIRSGEQMVKSFNEIRRIVGNFKDMSLLDAKKMFPSAFDNRVGELDKSLSVLKARMNEFNQTGLDLSNAQAQLGALLTQQKQLETEYNKQLSLRVDTTSAEKELDEAKQKVQEIREELKKELSTKLADTEKTKNSLEGKKQAILDARQARGATAPPPTIASVKKAGGSKEQVEAATQAINLYQQEQKALKEIEKALEDNSKIAEKYTKALGGADKKSVGELAEKAGVSSERFEQVNQAIDKQRQAEDALTAAKERRNAQEGKIKDAKGKLDSTTSAVNKQQKEVDKLSRSYNELSQKLDTNKMSEALQKVLGKDFTPDLLKNEQGVEQLRAKLQEMDQTSHQNLIQQLQQMGLSADQAEDQVKLLRDGLGGIRDGANGIAKAASEMDGLKNRILQFFSLTNSIQLFKRTVRSALKTVQELDKTMTEAAVVTDFSVGDMWDKLPTYSKHARELGVSINGMYQATTLYYQQGLKTTQAMEIGIETMKMAKIAGLDSADATQAMTAALRGFNMELNSTSAQRINDVYSQLAAVSAADVNKISTAMEKTASIASAANMEFETTAALLTQIIETTQEAPETAGTAMKTIIARFSEVKSLRDQGLTSGTDSEGEGIDVNNIQKALRSVGISMTGFFEGTEGLDSIFLKLAEKWDTLDFTTQRYIATMAAGSRQQSRFIAMMSDYKRTTELVGEAQNSAGASTRQFNKTLDSMESKLQKLKNAWAEFTMGITNNEILKVGIDLLTSLVGGINSATKALSGNNGLIKSVYSLSMAFAGIKIARGLFSGVFAKMGLGAVGGQKDTPSGAPTAKQRADEAFNSGGKWRRTKALGAYFYDKEGQQNKKGEMVQNRIIKNQTKQAKGKQFKITIRKGTNTRVIGQNKKESLDQYNKQIANITAKDGADLEKIRAEASKTYEQVLKETGDVGKATEAANRKVTELGGSFASAGTKAQGLAAGVKSINWQGIGQGAMMAGGAVMALGSIFSAFGIEDLGEGFAKAGGIIMAFGSILMVLPPIVKMVGEAFQTSFGWIGLVIGLLVTVIALVAAFVTQGKSLEEQLQDVNSQIDQMKDASQEAAEALERITETRQELYDMQDVFRGLVKGTDEWRKALVESNSKVLELLDTYPELVDYITTDADGMMSISSEGWAKITKKQQQAIVATQTSAAALQARKTDLQRQQIEKDKKLSDTEKKAKLTALEMQSKTQQQAYYTAAIASDRNLASSDYAQSAANVLSYESQASVAQEITDEEVKWANSNGFDDNQKKKLKKDYAVLTGKSLDEVSEIIDAGDITYEDMNAAIAADKVTKKKAEQMKNITEAISSKGKEDQKILEKMFTKDAKGLKKGDINSVKSALNLGENDKVTETALRAYLKEWNITLEQDQLQGLLDALNNASTAFSDTGEIIKEVNGWGLGDSETIKNFVTSTEYGTGYDLAKKFGELVEKGRSAEDVEGLIEQINKLVPEDAENRDEILGYLADTNWESKEDIARTMELFEEKGLDVTAIETLGESIDKLAEATSENTNAQLKQQSWNIRDVLEQVLSGEMDENNLSSDQVQALKDAGIANDTDFVQLGNDSYMYTGDLYSDTVNLYGDIIEKQGENTESASKKAERADAFERTKKTQNKELLPLLKFAKQEVFSKQDLINIDPYLQKHLGASLLQRAEQVKSSNGVYNTYEKEYGERYADEWALTTAIQQLQNEIQTNYVSLDDIVAEDFVAETDMEKELVDFYYKKAAKNLDFEINPDLTTEQQIAQLQDWEKLYGGKSTARQEANKEAIDQASSIVGNTSQTTAQIGYAQITGEYEGVEEDKEVYAKAYTDAIDNRLKATGGSVFLDEISKNLTAAEKAANKFDTGIKAVASDMASVAGKTKTLAENMSDLAKDLAMDKNTPEYGKALSRAKSNVANYFGVEKKDLAGISDDLYKRLAEGDPAALQEMQNKIAETLLNGYMIGATEFQNTDFAMMAGYLQVDPILDEKGMAKFKEEFGVDLANLTEEAQKKLETAMSLKGVQIAFERDKEGNIIGVTSSKLDRTRWYTNYTKPSGSSNKYENSYDKLHNTLEEINDLLRERERLERRYQRLLDRSNATAEKLSALSDQIVATYQLEIDKQEEVLSGRYQQINEEIAKNKGLQKYVQVETLANGEQSLRIDWNALEKLKNADTGEKVDEYYDNIQTWLESIREAEDAIWEAQDAIYEEMTKGMDEYLDFEEQVKEAIINSRQKEIDELSNINDSINDANSKLLDSMQEQIDAYRQARDNEKTEQELSDKQRRLSYLQQDTSGANALEIMQLQKEIEEGQESYTDQLIDQKISELQKQNDQAAEQRQHQIDLARAQLDQYSKSKEIWEKVENLIANGINQDGKLVGPLEALMKEANGYDSLSKIGQMKWLNDIETLIASALSWRGDGQKVMASLFGGSTVSFTTSDGKVVSGEVLEDGRVKDAETGNVYEKVVWGGEDKFTTTEDYQEKKEEVVPEEEKEPAKQPAGEYKNVTKWQVPDALDWNGKKGFSSKEEAIKYLKNEAMKAAKAVREEYAKSQGTANQMSSHQLQAKLSSINHQRVAAEKDITSYTEREWFSYKTGGLADFTGPAWLDGTKSKPEYILNADQTKAFFNLVDVLGSLQTGKTEPAQNSGDNTYDIDINVESIGSDYDVEQLASVVKRLIVDDANYRNNNAVNLMR